MTQEELNKLTMGDVIVNSGSGNVYVVVENVSLGVVVAVRSVSVTNPTEWRKLDTMWKLEGQ